MTQKHVIVIPVTAADKQSSQEKPSAHNEMWNIIGRVGTRQFQNPTSDVFFSLPLSVFYLMLLFHPFPLRLPVSADCVPNIVSNEMGVPRFFRDQWDALLSDYSTQKNTRMCEGHFCFFDLSPFIKMCCCCCCCAWRAIPLRYHKNAEKNRNMIQERTLAQIQTICLEDKVGEYVLLSYYCNFWMSVNIGPHWVVVGGLNTRSAVFQQVGSFMSWLFGNKRQ